MVSLDYFRVVFDLDLQESVNSDTLLVAKLSWCDDKLRVDQIEVVGVCLLELHFHWFTHIVEQCLDSGVPIPGKVLKFDAAYHADVLDQH